MCPYDTSHHEGDSSVLPTLSAVRNVAASPVTAYAISVQGDRQSTLKVLQYIVNPKPVGQACNIAMCLLYTLTAAKTYSLAGTSLRLLRSKTIMAV